ncbi:UNVERIFIED_CONTAM: hypothetical protein RMT77_008414 [Armadillidium vulgare]
MSPQTNASRVSSMKIYCKFHGVLTEVSLGGNLSPNCLQTIKNQQVVTGVKRALRKTGRWIIYKRFFISIAVFILIFYIIFYINYILY